MNVQFATGVDNPIRLLSSTLSRKRWHLVAIGWAKETRLRLGYPRNRASLATTARSIAFSGSRTLRGQGLFLPLAHPGDLAIAYGSRSIPHHIVLSRAFSPRPSTLQMPAPRAAMKRKTKQ